MLLVSSFPVKSFCCVCLCLFVLVISRGVSLLWNAWINCEQAREEDKVGNVMIPFFCSVRICMTWIPSKEFRAMTGPVGWNDSVPRGVDGTRRIP